MPTILKPRQGISEAANATKAARAFNLRIVIASLGMLFAVLSWLIDRDGLQGTFAEMSQTLADGVQLIASLPVPFG